jgi:amino acid adenylation domain-containing protein
MNVATGKNIEAFYPLSPMQQGMLFHTLYSPGSGIYLDQISCVLSGELNVAAFGRAWRQVLDRHAALRTGFLWEGLKEPVQVVRRGVELPLETLDWSAVDEDGQRALFDAHLETNRKLGFELSNPPLMRLALIKLGDRRHRLVWSRHHMVMDGWSVSILLGELFAAYDAFSEGMDFGLPAARPFRDYIAWLKRQDMAQAERFWRRALKGFTAPTRLGAAPASGQGAGDPYAKREIRLSAELTSGLRSFAGAWGLTLNTVIQGAWALLLNRYSGERDVLFGATVSGRPSSLPGVESMLGLFINTVPVRVDVPPDAPLIEILRGIQDQQSEVRQYDYAPLMEVHGWSEVPRGTPLFETLLVFQNYPLDEGLREQKSEIEIQDFRSFEQTNYPLTLDVGPGPQILLRALYDGGRFDSATVERILGHLEALLEGFLTGDVRRQENLSLASGREKSLLESWNDTARDFPKDQWAHTLFEEQAARTPNAVAVSSKEGSLSYRELNERANRLARRLRALGVGPEVVTGIYLDRSIETVVAALAVLKASGAYLPIDVSYPLDRVSFILEDAATPVVITTRDLAEGSFSIWDARQIMLCIDDEYPEPSAPEEASTLDGENLACRLDPDNLAYVIYTSGSTGRPKGVMIPHRGLTNYLCWARQAYPVLEGEGSPVHSPLCFDLTVTSLWLPLVSGKRVDLIGEREGVEGLIEALGQSPNYSLVKLTPAHVEALNRRLPAEAAAFSSRSLVIGGEALSGETLRYWRENAPGVRLINEYGPTETVVGCSVYEATGPEGEEGAVPIGRPIANTRIEALDRRLRPAGIGVVGEIVVSGEGVGRGYVGRADQTAESYIPDERGGSGARAYRTGDLGRWTEAGTLEYVGRRDEQVKVRGYRIELGEVETAIREQAGVNGAAVTVEGEGVGKRLVGYVVMEGGEEKLERVKAGVAGRLPEYMRPVEWVRVESLPLTGNGKVDRKALWKTGRAEASERRAYLPPRTPIEQTLTEVWGQALGVERVGITDNFFELGGHSLLAMQIVARVRESFKVDLPLAKLFDHPTVAAMAEMIADVQAEQSPVKSPAGPVIGRRARTIDQQLLELERS